VRERNAAVIHYEVTAQSILSGFPIRKLKHDNYLCNFCPTYFLEKKMKKNLTAILLELPDILSSRYSDIFPRNGLAPVVGSALPRLSISNRLIFRIA